MSEHTSMSLIEKIIRKNNTKALVKLFLKNSKQTEQKVEKSLIGSMGVDAFIGYLINFKDDEINDTNTAVLANYILPSDLIAWFDKNHAVILEYGRKQAEISDLALADWLGHVRLHHPVIQNKPDTALPSEDVLPRADLRALFACNGKYHYYYEPMAFGASSYILLLVMTKFEMFLEENYS